MTTTPIRPAADAAACACPEYTSVSRRGLFRGAALTGAVTAFGSTIVTLPAGAAFAATPAPSVVVVLSLRGACDGLSLVVPHGDPTYYAARPTIAVPREQLLFRDDFFGFHPAMSALGPLWNAGRLAAVHATGMPVANRSHFAAMELVEDADPGSTARIGWLNRLIGEDADPSPLQGLAYGGLMPTSLKGPELTMGLVDANRTTLAGTDAATDPRGARTAALNSVWGQHQSAYGVGFRSAVSATKDLSPVAKQPDNSARYPAGELGSALSAVARLLRADVGIKTATVDHGGWDMHTDLGTPSAGRMVVNAGDLAGSIAAFFADLGPVAGKVTLVTISEFGRRIAENGSHGLDHGWGNVMLLAGAGVKGGYHGRFPTIGATVDADLTVTTDYRSVLSEVVTRRMGASSAAVFPGFAPETVGVMS